MTYPISLYLTLGIGGARGDFVAGWIGSLPHTINNQWSIDPATGRSYGMQQNLRDIDNISPVGSNNLQDYLLNQFNWQLDTNAKYAYSGACHGYCINKQIHLDQLSAIKIIVIDTSQVDLATLHWEFCVKTYGFNERRRFCIDNNLPNYPIDLKSKNQSITNQERCELFKKELILNLATTYYPPPVIFPHVTMHYNDVISPDGSKKLAELLGINVDPVYHKLWQNNLELANTPDLINLFDQQWSKDDVQVIK